MEAMAPAVPARRWEALAPLTGIAAVLLFVAAFIVHDVIGETPNADAPASTFAWCCSHSGHRSTTHYYF